MASCTRDARSDGLATTGDTTFVLFVGFGRLALQLVDPAKVSRLVDQLQLHHLCSSGQRPHFIHDSHFLCAYAATNHGSAMVGKCEGLRDDGRNVDCDTKDCSCGSHFWAKDVDVKALYIITGNDVHTLTFLHFNLRYHDVSASSTHTAIGRRIRIHQLLS